MNIAITINDNYFYPLYIMLHTLFASNPNVNIKVFLIHSRVSRENVEKLQEVCEKYGGALAEIRVPDSLFKDAPEIRHFSKEMYYRILVARLMPETEERVLYMDPDIIVLDSLEKMYQTPLENYFFAGCVDRFIHNHHRKYIKGLQMKEDSEYFNSGILLCNLVKLREEQNVEEVFQTLQARKDDILFPDQDLLNILYEGKILRIEDRYNLSPNILYFYEFLLYNFLPGIKKPAVLHYMGKEKPWNPGYDKGLYQCYWRQELKYTYRSKKEIFNRIWKNPVYVLKIGWHAVWHRILRLSGKAAAQESDRLV